MKTLKELAAEEALRKGLEYGLQQGTKLLDAAAKETAAKRLEELEKKGVGALEEAAKKIGGEQREKVSEKVIQEEVEELLQHEERVGLVAGLVDFFAPEAQALGINAAQHFDRVLELLDDPRFLGLTLGQILSEGEALANRFPVRLRASAQFLIQCARRVNVFMGGSRDNRTPEQITMREFMTEMRGSLALLRPVIDGIRRTDFSELEIQGALDTAFNGPQTLLIANPLFTRFFTRRGISTPAQLRVFDRYCTTHARTTLARIPREPIFHDALRGMYARVLEGRQYIAALTHGHQLGGVQSSGRIEEAIGTSFENSSLTVTDLLQLSLFLQTALPETEPPTPIPASPAEGGTAIGTTMLQMKIAHLLVRDNDRQGTSFVIHRIYRGVLAGGAAGIRLLGQQGIQQGAASLVAFAAGTAEQQVAKIRPPDRIPTISEMQQELMLRLVDRASARATNAVQEWVANGGIQRMLEHQIRKRLNIESMITFMWVKLLTLTTLVENEPATFMPVLGVIAAMRAFGGHRAWMQWRLFREAGEGTALGRHAAALEHRLMKPRGLIARLTNPLTFAQAEVMTDSWRETRAVIQQFEVTQQLPERAQKLLGGGPLTEGQIAAIIDVRTMCIDPEHLPGHQAVIDRLTQTNCFSPLQAERIVSTFQTEGHLPTAAGQAPVQGPRLVFGAEDRLRERQTRVTELLGPDSLLVQQNDHVLFNDMHLVFSSEGIHITPPTTNNVPAPWSITFAPDGQIRTIGDVPPQALAAAEQRVIDCHARRRTPRFMSRITGFQSLQARSTASATPPPSVSFILPSGFGGTGGTLHPRVRATMNLLTDEQHARLTPEERVQNERLMREVSEHFTAHPTDRVLPTELRERVRLWNNGHAQRMSRPRGR